MGFGCIFCDVRPRRSFRGPDMNLGVNDRHLKKIAGVMSQPIVKDFRHFPLLTRRTKRSSKNCAGLAVFASGIDSERKSKMP